MKPSITRPIAQHLFLIAALLLLPECAHARCFTFGDAGGLLSFFTSGMMASGAMVFAFVGFLFLRVCRQFWIDFLAPEDSQPAI